MNRGGVTLVALAISAATVWAADPTQQQLMDEINALKNRVAQLEAEKTAPSSAEIKRTTDAVVADAAKRSAFGDANLVGGWNADKKQFFLGTSDGTFYLHPGFIFQFRNATSFSDNTKHGSDNIENGFEVRRMKFSFDGNAFTKDLTYKFQWQDSNNGGTPSLEWGYGQYVFAHGEGGRDWAIRAGQIKDPVFKEEAIVGDNNQLMVERSLANALVGGLTTGPLIQGVDLMLTGKDNPLHADLVFHDGTASGNTDFQNVLASGAKDDFGVAVRVDYKVFGDWADTTDLTGKNSGKTDLLDIGGGIDFTQADNSDAVRWSVDAQYMTAKKISLFAAIYGDHFDFRNNIGEDKRDDYAGTVEGGYMLNSAWQLVARYSLVLADSDFKSNGEDTFHEVAVGVNYFLGDNGSAGNHAKLTLDLNYLPNGTPAATGLDYLASPGENQFVARAQFQLWL